MVAPNSIVGAGDHGALAGERQRDDQAESEPENLRHDNRRTCGRTLRRTPAEEVGGTVRERDAEPEQDRHGARR